ncbi:MAG: Fe-S cluster assembly protein SufD [Candidatus Zixiibacteriota bacterium]
MNDKLSEYTIPEISPELERGSQWLKEKRYAFRKSFNRMPLPRRGLHLWRYTDPHEFIFEHEKAADTAFHEDYDEFEQQAKKQLEESHLDALVIEHGGRDIRLFGTDQIASRGIIVSTLSEAFKNHYELVESHLYRLINNETGKFEALNSTLWNDGILIFVPDNQTLEKPIHLLRMAGRANSNQHHRLLVIAGKNSELTLIDEYGGGADDENQDISLVNSAVEIFGGENSRLRYVSLQRQARNSKIYLTHRARAEKDAKMYTIPLIFGAALSKQNFGVVLNDQGAESHITGLLFGTGYQQFDNHTLHHHASSQSFSNIDFKVVLRDKARSAYTGLIRIENEARACEAYQENRNLLLNQGARAESIPELEILNEDVQCSHGATVGPIDPMMIFFLKSRGISESEAVRMVVTGFVEATLNQLPDDIKERLRTFVTRRLEDI